MWKSEKTAPWCIIRRKRREKKRKEEYELLNEMNMFKQRHVEQRGG